MNRTRNLPLVISIAVYMISFIVCAGCCAASVDAEESGTAAMDVNALSAWQKPTGDWMVVQQAKLDPDHPDRLAGTEGSGTLLNGPNGRTVDLLTRAEYGDVRVQLEFCIAQHSNSGVYFMGRYELQIYDSYQVEKDKYPGIECGGLYPRWTTERGEFEGHSPRKNVSRPAGQWQSFEVVFRAPRFNESGEKIANARFEKVLHNGQLIHENVEITGPTRAAHWEKEAAVGPLMLQGDHGPVAFRNLKIEPLKVESSSDNR